MTESIFTAASNLHFSFFVYNAILVSHSKSKSNILLQNDRSIALNQLNSANSSFAQYNSFKNLNISSFKIETGEKTVNRENAAFVILVRNNELAEMKIALRSIEDRFNRNYKYPYVFLNDVPFTEKFKHEISAFTTSEVQFGIVPKEHWGYPSWIDQKKAQEQRDIMAKERVFYGSSESYRHMCRFNSGFFYKHPLLQQFDYYWRIEPGVDYSCDIDFDPFKYMRENGIKYGFTIALYEYFNTIPTLWKTVKDFATANSNMVSKNNALSWITHDGGQSYSGCHFWSNFEIGSFEFLRSKEYNAFFDYLDQAGGFFYERWGDAPVHSIAAAMFLSPKQIHWFDNIGYSHSPWTNCPQDSKTLLKCTCNPKDSAIHHPYAKCTSDFRPDLPSLDVDAFVNSGIKTVSHSKSKSNILLQNDRSIALNQLNSANSSFAQYNSFKNLNISSFKIETGEKTVNRENAAFVILVRNNELAEMKIALRSIEDRFNRNYKYPYVFLNDVPFTEKFKHEISAFTTSEVQFGIVPKEHWGYPSWIDQKKAQEQRDIMAKEQVFYGSSESYRHMCRFNSGFFYKHPLLQQFDYYWRIEPGVDYSCDIDFDPFKYMRENGIKYGFTIALYEYFNTIPTLWKTVKDFATANSNMVSKNNALSWITHDGGQSYSGCHFWSNFEIGSFEFLRSKEYNAFFDYLDQAGGFFYERWGDAPVHSIAAAMFLSPKQIHWFDNIGYSHSPWTNCPQDSKTLLKCTCNPKDSAIHHPYAKCTSDFRPDLPSLDVDAFVNSGIKTDTTFLSEVPSPNKKQILEGLFPLFISNKNNYYFKSKDQFEWGRAMLVQGLLLPIDYIDTMYSTVEIYKTWLLSPNTRPSYIEEDQIETFLKVFNTYFKFCNDSGISSVDALEKLKAAAEPIPDPPTSESLPIAAPRSKKGLLNLNKFNILNNNQAKLQQSTSVIDPEINKKINMTPVEKYIELLKQVLQVFTVLTRISSGNAWGKVIIQTIVKCMTGIADFCLKKGNPNEQLLPDEQYFRSIDPMWSEVGTAVSELLMRNFFEVWFRTETVDENMWGSFRARIQYWIHRPQVVDDWVTAVVAFTRRSYRILYDEDPRIGTKLLVVELGNSYILFTLPQLMNLIKHTYRLNGDSFRAAINGMATICRELIDLDNIIINPSLGEGPSNNNILDMIGVHFFDGVLKTSSESYKTTNLSEKIDQYYIELFYLVLKQAFLDSSCLQSVLIHGHNLLFSGIPGIRAFVWEFSKGTQYILPRMVPDFVAAVNPDKLRASSCINIALLLSLTYNIKDVNIDQDDSDTCYSADCLSQVENLDLTSYQLDENRFKDIDFITTHHEAFSTPNYRTDNLYKTVNNLQDIIKNISDTISYNFDDMSIYLNPSLFSGDPVQRQPEIPKTMNEIYMILLPVVFLTLSTESSEQNMTLLINSLVVTSIQNQDMRKDLCISILELLLSEVYQVKNPGAREIQILRGIKQLSFVLRSHTDEHYIIKTIKDIHAVFINALKTRINKVCFRILIEVLDCLRWWLTQNSWLIETNEIKELLGEIWEYALLLDKFILSKKSEIVSENDFDQSKEFQCDSNGLSSLVSGSINDNSTTGKTSTIKNVQTSVHLINESKNDSACTKNSISNINDLNNTSKKMQSFFNSKKNKMAKMVANEVKKINYVVKIDSKSILNTSEPAANPEILAHTDHNTAEKLSKPLYDVLFESRTMDSPAELYMSEIKEDMSERLLFALHNSIFEFSNSLNRVFLNNSKHILESSLNTISEVHEEKEKDIQYYYFKESKSILKIYKKNSTEYILDIQTIVGWTNSFTLTLNDIEKSLTNGINSEKHSDTVLNDKPEKVDSSVIKSPLGTQNNSNSIDFSFTKSAFNSDSELTSHIDKNYYNSLFTKDGKYLENNSAGMDELISKKDDNFIDQLNDFKSIMDSIANINNGIKSNGDYGKIDKYNLKNPFETSSHYLKLFPYRMPTLIQNDAVYRIYPNKENIQLIENIKGMAPEIQINIGLYSFSSEESAQDIENSNYINISKGLFLFSKGASDDSLKIGNHELTCPISLGYDLKYSTAESAIKLGANQFMFYIDNTFKERININHMILKLKHEGFTGISRIDKLLKNTSSKLNYDQISLKLSQNKDKNDNFDYSLSFDNLLELNKLPNVQTQPLKIFYLVSPFQNLQSSLMEVTKVVYGCNQTDFEYFLKHSGPINDRSIVHIDYLHIFLTLSFIETQKSINRILGIGNTM
ncbi:hypothetical protein BB561_000895 [Smittium simulii]|uniref:Ral GTPase-activating protein subunit alpha/beta N-terminal domain-containing protein n=1 Tax=Smittium simulii TaxID=133385 RepID=A0A2T9YX22_9FUNG|nr:hypothetical protein BB561_000895 [Smittium simulii]